MTDSWDEERRNYRGGQNRPGVDHRPRHTRNGHPAVDRLRGHRPGLAGWQPCASSRDRDGVANIWSYDPASKDLKQLTKFTDFDVKTLESRRGRAGVRAGGLRARAGPRRRRIERVAGPHRRGRPAVDAAALGGRRPLDGLDSRSRPPASARWSKLAARCSASLPRRATCATCRARAARPSATPSWSPDGKSVGVLQRPLGRVPARGRGRRTASRPRVPSRSAATASTTRSPGRRTPRSSSYHDTDLNVWVLDVATSKAQHARPRAVDGAAAHALPRVEPRFALGRHTPRA